MADTIAVSPDLEALYCYGVVLFAGLIVAYVQVRRFFEGKPGAWGTLSIWGLFGGYALIPVALFWLLDRTDAIHDTSLFAALLVGFGYQQVLTASSSTISAPVDVTKWWQPFQKWANRTAERILDRVKVNGDRFAQTVIDGIRADNQKLERLRKLALMQGTEAQAQALDAQFNALSTPENQALFGPDGVREKQITLLYRRFIGVPDSDYLLYRHEIISRPQYLWYAKEGRTTVRAIGVWLVVVITCALWGPRLFNGDNAARYYLWRLEKSNATNADRARAKVHLMDCIKGEPEPNLRIIAARLQYDDVPVETVERLLAILVQSRSLTVSWEAELTQALRTENPDSRARVQSTLVYLATDQNLCIPGDLRDWKPSKSDAMTSIDEHVKRWLVVWQTRQPKGKSCEV